MKVRMLLLAAAIMAMASAGFAQGFNVSLIEAEQMLTTTCGGNIGIPDGTPVYIYHDRNANGPDPADQLAELCELDPTGTCIGGVGRMNYNTFLMNGEAMELGAGFFATEIDFLSFGAMPTPNARFYLVVNYPPQNPMIRWTSGVFTCVMGWQEFWLARDTGPWTCQTLVQPCVPSPDTYFNYPSGPLHSPNPNVDMYACVQLCPGQDHNIYVGPLVSRDRVPHVNVTPGCFDCMPPVQCPPAQGYIWDNSGTFDPANPQPGWVWVTDAQGLNWYVNTIICPPNMTRGCVCLWFDWILPVEMGDVAINPGDNEVNIRFTTRSENNLLRFEIRRDGEVVERLNASNNPSGANYTYTDGNVSNGTTYTYEIVVVGLNGAYNLVATEKVTPSFENGVPTTYALYQNFPNPFNPSTDIRFDVKEDNVVTLTIYNAMGQKVATLIDNVHYKAGRKTVRFDASNLTSGLYFYTVKIGNEFTATKKMLLVK